MFFTNFDLAKGRASALLAPPLVRPLIEMLIKQCGAVPKFSQTKFKLVETGPRVWVALSLN